MNVWSRLQARIKEGLRIDRDEVCTEPVGGEPKVYSPALAFEIAIHPVRCHWERGLPDGWARQIFSKQVNSN
jgi:hypothetical protein